MAGDKIGLAPQVPKTPTTTSSTAGSGGTGSSGSGSGTGKSGTKGSGSGSGSSLEADYKRRQAEADRRARHQEKTTLANIRNIIGMTSGQIKAVKQVLSAELRDRLDQQLRNIELNQDISRKNLLDAYDSRVADFKASAEDNVKAADADTYANLTNRSRERGAALSQTALHGAGESDNLRAAAMSLRNWSANQSEVQRGYYDTLRSINSALHDATAQTRGQLITDTQAANAQKAQTYDKYYSDMSEKWSQLGDLYGQRSEQYGNVWSMTSDKDSAAASKGFRTDLIRRNRNKKKAQKAYMNAADFTGESYVDTGLPADVQNWQGAGSIASQNNASLFQTANTVSMTKKPEGATLRKWTI